MLQEIEWPHLLLLSKISPLLITALRRYNSFLTVDTFPDGTLHFLDITIDKNYTDIYYKETHTGQYTSFHSQIPWHSANKICSSKQAFQQQIDHIKPLMSWNAYPKYVRNSIINRLKLNANRNDNINNNKDYRKVIW